MALLVTPREHVRRWQSPDGLVHLTRGISIGQNSIGLEVFVRVLLCADFRTVKVGGQELRENTVESVDVRDDPSPVSCFGCMGAL